jgi:Sulfotransferase family
MCERVSPVAESDVTSANQAGPRRYVFICGLHRSGTTALARTLATIEECTVFTHTTALMDEGQFLQDIYPPDNIYGGAGVFGFDERAHLTEQSTLLTAQNTSRLRKMWHSHWDTTKSICVEKTPGNILMTRFLQAAFPTAHFIVIRRHPVAVSLATQKWSRTPVHSLFDHWLRCHELFERDKPHLAKLYELRYEDYVRTPIQCLMEIADFIQARLPNWFQPDTTDLHNRKYFDQWVSLLERGLCRSYYHHLLDKYEPRFERYGYSLHTEVEGRALSSVRGATLVGPLCQLLAEGLVPMRRATLHCEVAVREVVKRVEDWRGTAER